MRTFDFDVAVIGAGPAGASAALAAARRGLSVIQFEVQRAPIDKPCGEGILPQGVEALRALGVELDGNVFDALSYSLEGVRPLEVRLPRRGVALERPELLRAIDNELQRERRVFRVEEGAQIDVLDGGYHVASASIDVVARCVIAADGLGGRAAAFLTDERKSNDERVGVRARYQIEPVLERVEVHLTRECELYLTPLSNRRVNLAVLFARLPDGVRGAEDLVSFALARAPDVARRLGDCVTPPACRKLGVAPPSTLARDGAFLAGDAGGGVDPIVGCGTSLAIVSAVHAASGAEAIVRGAPAEHASAVYERAYSREARSRRALAGFLRRVSTRPALARSTVEFLRHTTLLLDGLVRTAIG